jgi:hypothetical protein
MAVAFVLLASPLHASSRLIFPRVTFQGGRWAGIAVANPTSFAADVSFKAWTTDGTLFSGTGVTNPATQRINPGSQYVKLATEIFFQSGVPALYSGAAPTRLWVEATSTTDGLTGFYLEGDGGGTYMDGSDLSGSGTDLFIPIIENTGGSTTEISLVNPNPETHAQANLTLTFYREDGTTVATRSRSIPPNGTAQGPLSELFADVDFAQVHGVRILSDRPVAGYVSIFQTGNKSLITIAAQNAALPAKTLYFPQLAEGAGWSTAVGVQNMTGSDIMVTLTAYDSDGNLFAPPLIKQNPVTQTIKANGLIHARLSDQDRQNWFGFTPTDPSTPLQGWLKVDASASAINGFVEYSAGDNRALVPAQLKSYSKAIFSYQVQASGYFTGLAILNPGSVATNVEITSLRGDANPHGKAQLVLKPGQKISKLIWELVGASRDAANGSVFVKSDSATIATQLFGTNTFSALANVAPQEVTTDWDPGAILPKLSLSPQLSVVETGKTKAFTVSGLTGSAVSWSVDSGCGTISGSGDSSATYQAPAAEPSHHNLAVVAKSDSRSAGATIDVVQREKLTGGLTLLTAVAYLDNLSRFYVAEQQVLSSAGSIHPAAGGSSTKISRLDPGSSTPVPVKSITGDTIPKMLPFSDGGKDYLILAGYDSGNIYRLDASGGSLATVATALNKPSSLAFDPATGDLLVAESGLSRISVVSRAKLTSAAAPGIQAYAGTPWSRGIPAISAPGLQGLATDGCSGKIYATLSDGSVHEYKGNVDRKLPLSAPLTRPRQIQVIYRDGLSCSEGLTLAIVEASQITLVYPSNGRADTLVSGVQNVQDITFFPSRNPYIPGGEASIGLAEGPSGTGQSQISDIQVGGIYQATVPAPIKKNDQASGVAVVPYEDPPADTFATTASTSSGYQIPDILSVNYALVGSFHVISISFSFPVVPIDTNADPYSGITNPPNSIDGTIWLDTGTGGVSLQELYQYQPLTSSSDFQAQYYISLADKRLVSTTATGGGYYPYESQGDPVPVSFLGNTVSVMIPNTTFDARRTRIAILTKNQAENTDFAPNAGVIKLTP